MAKLKALVYATDPPATVDAHSIPEAGVGRTPGSTCIWIVWGNRYRRVIRTPKHGAYIRSANAPDGSGRIKVVITNLL